MAKKTEQVGAKGPKSSPLPLTTPLDTLGFSIRAKNLFYRSQINFLGDLIQWTPGELLALPGCGQTTLQEIIRIVEMAGFQLATWLDNWGPGLTAGANNITSMESNIRTLNYSSAPLKVRAILDLSCQELCLSVRASNVCKYNDTLYVGELIQKSERDLLNRPNCGRTTLAEIKSKLEVFDLTLNMRVSGWDRSLVEENRRNEVAERRDLRRRIARERIAGPLFQHDVDSLEDELAFIASALTTKRNTDLIMKLWGWNGNAPRTLQSVGDEFGLTRERVRQIAARTEREIQSLLFDTNRIDRAVSEMNSTSMATRESLIKKLQLSGIAVGRFEPSSVIATAKIFGKDCHLRKMRVYGPQNFEIYASEAGSEKFKMFVSLVRKETSSNGCANFLSLCDELNFEESEKEAISEIVSDAPEFYWLDEKKTWILSNQPTRNRLENLMQKVFSVCKKIRVNELRYAVGRHYRLTRLPPSEVIGNLAVQLKLGSLSDGFLEANPNRSFELVEGSAEDVMIKVIKKYGPQLLGEEFLEKCVEEFGIGVPSFYVNLTYSPVITRLAPGVYGPVGAKVEPGVIESLTSRRRKQATLTSFGWTPSGTLWFGLQLTPQLIHTGSLILPSFVADVVEGEWKVCTSDQKTRFSVAARNGFLFRMRKPFIYLEAEPSDWCVTEFDLNSKHLTVYLGGPDLLDRWENPTDFEFDEDELDDPASTDADIEDIDLEEDA